MQTQNPFATFAVGGLSTAVRSVRGSEAVSTLFEYEIEYTAPLPLPRADAMIGSVATLHLNDQVGTTRPVTGVVSECTASSLDQDVGAVRVVLRPKVFDLTLGRVSRTFQSTTLTAIVTTVLGAHAADSSLAFDGSALIAYRVERSESDWSFLERTLAAAGLIYFFDHSAGSSLVITDSLDRGPVLDGRLMPVRTSARLGEIAEGILSIAKVGAATTSAHAAKGFRWEKPTLGVAAKAGGGRYESYDHVLEIPGLHEVGGSLMKQAVGRASSGRIAGTARSVRLYPGVSFSTDGDEAGNHAITAISVDTHFGEASVGSPAQGASLALEFSAAPEGSGVLPDPPGPGRTLAGLSYAIISADEGDEVYPDEKGRVRAQHHWDRGGTFDASSGTWVRPTQRFTPASMMFPRSGWVVATMGHRGDGDAPIALGRIHDGEHPPSYALPENKTRVVYKTATTPGGGSFNEIHFEDKKDAEVMYIHASKNTDILTKNFKAEHVNNDAWHTVDGEQKFTHQDSVDERVKISQSVSIGHDEVVVVKGNETKTVTKNETITIAGSRNINAKLSHTASSTKPRNLKVGAAMIDISLGQISRSAKNAMTLVGGAIVRLAGSTISRQVGPVWLETVGGLKYQKSGNSVNEAATKSFTETVGGSITLNAGTNINEDSGNESTWTVAGKLSGTAKEATLEAHDVIQITCGKSVLKIDDKGITLSSVEIELQGGAIEVLSGLIAHN